MAVPHDDDGRAALLEAALTDLVEVGRDLWEARLVTSHGGNLSHRWEQGAYVTRHGAMMHRLSRNQFVAVDSRGRPTSSGSTPEPSVDTPVHLAVYRSVPEAQVVVHAHPTYAVAQSLEWGALTPRNLSGALVGRVPVLLVEPEEEADAVAEALQESPVVLVRAHGAYARAATAWEALQLVSVLEEAATILYLSEQ